MKILLVEDSDEIRERLRSLIGELGVASAISQAMGEDEAVMDIRRDVPDLMILDLNLAQGSGFGVLRSLKECSKPPRVAVLTNHAEGPYRKKCLELGAEWFLDKAHGVEEVQKVIEQVGRNHKKTIKTTGACNVRN